MRITIKKQNSTLNVFAALLLFLSAEKFASCNFTFNPNPFPLQNSSITLIDHNPNILVYDFLAVFSNGFNTSTDYNYTGSNPQYNAFAILKYHYATFARLILQNTTCRQGSSFTQFRLDIKQSNLPSFSA